MGISRIFDIARRSLGTYQQALNVTSHNIANAGNPNYSRQVVNFKTERPELSAGFAWGAGVKLSSVQRVRDQFTDSQIRVYNQQFSYNNSESGLLGQVEQIFTEPSTLGLSNLTSEFFNSWSELSVTPNSTALRDNVIHSAKRLSSRVKNINDDLSAVKGDILASAHSKVEKVNELLKNIQSMNKQVFEMQTIGASANDLMDERDALVDQLSSLVNSNITYDDKGSVQISIGGVYAVDSQSSTQFKVGLNNGKIEMTTADETAKVNLSSGEIAALADNYNNKIPKYQADLSSIMTVLFESINKEHEKGYNLSDPPKTGIKFFESFENGELKINSDLLNDPKLLAVSEDGTSGNGAIALAIAELQGQKLLNGSTLSDNYSTLISGIGTAKASADQAAETNYMVLNQLEYQKQSYSGVSIDEEMTNVIRFQRSYDASARLIRVADEMLQTIINMV
jgi:flagellar hook-associated protein 1